VPNAFDHHASAIAKSLYLGDSSVGKTGSIAALVAAGYNVRMLDFDNGADLVVHFLTDYRYPYRKVIEARGIDLSTAFYYVPIQEKMKTHVQEKRVVPATARGWGQTLDMIDNWVDGNVKLGDAKTWTDKDVLVLDTFGTLAHMAYWHVQALNGRLGARMEGYDYQRDIGGAQNLLEGLLQELYGVHYPCNIIIITHITMIDDSRGVAAMPNRDPNAPRVELKGYPTAIGRALSPRMGKYFNNVLLARTSGSGASTKREIHTLPQDGILVKNTMPGIVAGKYPIESGLAEIFAALKGQAPPQDLLDAIKSGPFASTTLQADGTKKPVLASAALS
jgi:hypothetical protein